MNIFIGIGGLHVVLIGTLVSPKRDNVCENIMLIRNQSQLLLFHLNIQAQQKITKISPPPRNFHEDEGNSNSEIHDSETDSSQNTPSQPTNNSSRTAANQAVFPLDPRLKEIQEPLTVKPRGRPSGSLNKKRSRKSHDFEQSTRRELSRFEHVERNILASQQGIRRSGIRGKAIRRGQNQLQGRSDPTSTPGNITGIPTEMTSVFRI